MRRFSLVIRFVANMSARVTARRPIFGVSGRSVSIPNQDLPSGTATTMSVTKMIMICMNVILVGIPSIEEWRGISEWGFLKRTGTDSPLQISCSELHKGPNHERSEEDHAMSSTRTFIVNLG